MARLPLGLALIASSCLSTCLFITVAAAAPQLATCPALYTRLGAPVIGSGHIANAHGVGSAPDCACRCQALEACLAFDYAPVSSADAPNCWLKDNMQVQPPDPQKERISGVICRGGSSSNCTLPPAPPAPPGPLPANGTAVAAIGPAVVHTTRPEYASVDVDWWHDCGSCSGGDWFNEDILHIDLESPRLRALVRALQPLFIRIGGSEDNVAKYQLGGMTLAECRAPSKFRDQEVSLCMNRTRWDQVLDFYQNGTGARLVFGVSYFTGSDGRWNSTNVEALLRYTAMRGVTPAALELGEEMAPKPGSQGFTALVDGYARLTALASSIWPQSTPIILGPSCGMGDETTNNAFMQAFLKETVDAGTVGGVNMHSYNNDGGWPQPGFLRQTMVQADAMMNMTRQHSAATPLWCGECGPHNGGGIRNVTDRAVSSFWYLDALGSLARLGFEQHGRQALAGSHYGLLQATSHEPNPDYWVLWAWKQFMGARVLPVNLSTAAAPGERAAGDSDQLHVYAHCSPRAGGGIGLAFVNISPETTFAVTVTAATAAGRDASPAPPRREYHFTAPAGLLGRQVAVNGVVLQLVGEAGLPVLPAAIDVAADAPMRVGPSTFGFAHISLPPDAKSPC